MVGGLLGCALAQTTLALAPPASVDADSFMPTIAGKARVVGLAAGRETFDLGASADAVGLTAADGITKEVSPGLPCT